MTRDLPLRTLVARMILGFLRHPLTFKGRARLLKCLSAFCVLHVGAATQPLPPSTIYLEHVMKTGGTDACAAHRLSRGCSVDVYWNCRLTGYATTHWLNKTSGLHPTHPDLTAELVQRGAQSTKSICGIVSKEQGWTGLGRSPGKYRYGALASSFWDAYTTPSYWFVTHGCASCPTTKCLTLCSRKTRTKRI